LKACKHHVSMYISPYFRPYKSRLDEKLVI
jgi:hypothetical protein